ncbi:MAG: GyrI-like domain-containing protein [Thermoclostridium sp.]|nr:GyrI-like domain-containing protein [Thermoclostridium sp.]
MKKEWKKDEKAFYLPKTNPELIQIPSMSYFMLDGRGNPNSEAFAEAVGVLFSLAYGVKMLPKKGLEPEGYYEYSVYPLEGVWDLDEKAGGLDYLDKDKLIYTLMIRQPGFVTDELAQGVIDSIKIKKPHPLLQHVWFGKLEEGLCVQMLHIGPYDDEPESFSLMEEYCRVNQVERVSKLHREIYLTDARKTAPNKMKTILRFVVKPSN